MSALRTKEISGNQGSINKITIDDVNNNIKFYANHDLKMIIDENGIHPSIGVQTVQEYSIFIPGGLETNKKIFQLTVSGFSLIFPTSLNDSRAYSGTNPSSNTSLDLKKNNSLIGSVNWNNSISIWGFTFPNDIEFDAGDVLSVHTSDAVNGLEDFSLTLIALRNL